MKPLKGMRQGSTVTAGVPNTDLVDVCEEKGVYLESYG